MSIPRTFSGYQVPSETGDLSSCANSQKNSCIGEKMSWYVEGTASVKAAMAAAGEVPDSPRVYSIESRGVRQALLYSFH